MRDKLCLFAFSLAVVLAGAGLPRASGQSEGRVVSADRIVLNGSYKEVAVDAAHASGQQAVVKRTTLNADELGSAVHFEVGLAMRDLAQLQAREAAGETISPGELEAKYLPSKVEFKQVTDWLTAQGFTIETRDGNRLAVFAQGSVAQVQKSFQTAFARVTFEGKEYSAAVRAPSVPASLPVVIGISGLQPFQHYRTVPHVRASPQTSNAPPYLVSEILGAFNATGTTLTGANQEIGIVIDALPTANDLTVFWSDNDVNQTLDNIYYEYTPNSSGEDDGPSGEETLDVSWSSAIAPGATVDIFTTGTLDFVNTDAAYSTIGTELKDGDQPNLHQLSISYGADEDEVSDDQITMDEGLLATIASYGVTIFVASGDNGAFDSSGGLSVSYPASDPSVTAVGGVSIVLNKSTGAVSTETAWTADADGFSDGRIAASGGGYSRLARPSWQTGAGVPSGTTRCVPDVAASSDQNEAGILVFTYDGSQETFGGANGTSWAAPTWAGLCALINQARANHSLTSLGLLNPRIYPLIGSNNFRDITTGNNSHYGKSDGYAAGSGYDLVTGIGTPNFSNLVTTLSTPPPTVTSFSPASGPVGTTVVINGTNFTSVLSVTFGGVAAAGSFTATQITATVPSGAPTGKIKVTTAGGSASSATNFTVTKIAPVITSATTATATDGAAFSYQITANNAPVSYSVQGLPAGLTANNKSGLISGTPTASGAFSVTLNAYNSGGKGSATLSLTVKVAPPVVTSATTASGTDGDAFSYQITASNAPASFSVQGLPAGLSVNTKTGLISGTPTASGSFAVTLNAYNSAGKGSAQLTLTIGKIAPVVTSATTASGTVGTAFSYQITAANAPVSYSVQGLPAGLSANNKSGLISGTPTAAGTFAVTLNAYNSAGKGSASLTLTVH